MKASPEAEALREPTIATQGLASARASPRIISRGGALSIIRSSGGYSGSLVTMKRAPIARDASISRSASSRSAMRIARPLSERATSSGNASSAAEAPP